MIELEKEIASIAGLSAETCASAAGTRPRQTDHRRRGAEARNHRGGCPRVLLAWGETSWRKC